jgi:hypothetical protein
VAVCPSLLVAVTVKVCAPVVEVSIGLPFATGPAHDATPDAPGGFWHP